MSITFTHKINVKMLKICKRVFNRQPERTWKTLVLMALAVTPICLFTGLTAPGAGGSVPETIAPFGLMFFIAIFTSVLFLVFREMAASFHRAHTKLESAVLFSNRVLEVCPGAITVADVGVTKTEYISGKLPKLLGYHEHDTGKGTTLLKDIIHPEDCKMLRQEISNIKDWHKASSKTFEIRCRHKDGSWRTLLTSVAPFRLDAKGNPIDAISCALDITKEKKLQKDLESANKALLKERENLMRSNKDLEVFASLAAHDLKSPLQSAMSWLAHLSDQLAAQPQHETLDITKPLDVVQRNITKSISYINDLLTISRLNSDHTPHEPLDLRTIVDDILCIHAIDIKKTNAVIKVGAMPLIDGNPQQIECVISNLIRNALRYRAPNRRPIIEIGADEVGGKITLFVKDNGIGIPNDKLADIFNLFERLDTDQNETGTGMGLAYCRKVINLHGGEIWAESVQNQGTTIKFSIPAHEDVKLADQNVSPPARFDHLRLDDNPPISQYVYSL